MFPPFSPFFRKNGGDSPAEPAGNEDLECGRGSSLPQTPMASGYQSSPSRVYLPETQILHESTIPQIPTPSRGYFSHVQYNGKHGSAEPVPLTPSGPSKVLGYLPRAIYSGSSPFFVPPRPIMPARPSQNTGNRDFIHHSEPRRRSASVSSIVSHRSPSPRSPFDPSKHGQALRRLETHGSLKTIPSGQQEGDAVIRTSISWSEIGREIFEEDHAVGVRGSLLQQPDFRTSADPYEIADRDFGVELSSSLIQYLPSTVYQPEVLSEGESSKAVNLPDPQKPGDGQSLREALPSFVFPLPNSRAIDSNQFTQQSPHWSQLPPKAHQALSPKSLPGEPIAADALPDHPSKNPSSEGMPENDTIASIVRNMDTQGSKQLEDMSTNEEEEEEDQQRPVGYSAQIPVQSPAFDEIDEYLWSPAPSDDGQEAPLAPHTPVSHHAPSDVLRASPVSGLPCDSHGVFSQSSDFHGSGEHMHSRSRSSGNPCVPDSPLPHINVLIPAGNIDLDSHSDLVCSSQHTSRMGSRESSGILFRYSGLITDGTSARPMSEIELKEEVLHSLGNRVKTGLSMLNSRDSSSQAGSHTNPEQIPGEHKPSAQSEALPLDRVQNPSADDGPGSSQTSSSLSTDCCGDGPSGHKARLGNHTLPSYRRRCPTPPLLYGKHAISEAETSNTISRPAIGGTFSRFDLNARAVRLQQTSRLPTALRSLGDRDWETVSTETEADAHAFHGMSFDMKTGSSLADNSDYGSLSMSRGTPYALRGVKARPVMQHPAHPRHNYSFVLLKNSQTGDLVRVPQYEYSFGGRLPNNNTSARLVSRVRADSTYEHPPPLQVKHNHPFTSSSPTIPLTKPSAASIEDNFLMQQNHLISDSSSSGLSGSVQELEEKQTLNPLYKTFQKASRICGPTVDRNHEIMDSKEQSHQSSAWLSTVSEVASSEPSLPENGDSFTKMIVWDEQGHVNGTPEQKRGGNREVGSSLADASSPGANFSSSPAPLTSSPIQNLDTPTSSGHGFYKQPIQHISEYGSQHLLGDFHNSLVRSFSREDSATSTNNIEHRSRSHSASEPRLEHRELSPRRHGSSSESHSSLMDSSSAPKASALNLSSSDGHAQQIASFGVLLRNQFSHSDDNDSQYNPNQDNIIESGGRQPKADNASIDDPTTPSSTASRPFVRDGTVHTDAAPPILQHPCYGRDRPWDRVKPGHPRPRLHSDPLGRLVQRPIARTESPHLYRIPHPPIPEFLERHVLLSRIYLVPCMVIPPIALVYGHGYLDGIVRFHTAGEINGFRNTEKTLALCWGYGSSAISVLAIVITMIIISAS